MIKKIIHRGILMVLGFSCCLFSAEGVKSGSVWIEGCHFILPNLFTG